MYLPKKKRIEKLPFAYIAQIDNNYFLICTVSQGFCYYMLVYVINFFAILYSIVC